jgi:CubicO group peptidase (beta-lactamase class C family)
VRLLEGLVASGHLAGYQVSVRRADRAVDAAGGDTGLGCPVAVDTVFNVWCAAKPLVALNCTLAFRSAGVSLDGPLAVLDLGLPEWSSGLTPRQILNHDHPHPGPNALDVALERVGEVTLEDLLQEVDDQAPGYSEIAGWWLLVSAARRLTGRCPVAEGELRFEGIRGRFLDRDEFRAHRDQIGVYVGASGVPMLQDTIWSVVGGGGDDLVSLASARGLADFYRWTLRCDGAHREVLTDHLVHGGAARWDSTLSRRCRFAGGFMVDLSDHDFGDAVSSDAYGHLGWLGSSFGFADPAEGIAAAVVTNAFRSPDEQAAIRPDLVAAVYEEARLLG